MATWNIRKAESSDADALSNCMGAAYSECAARISDLPPMTSADCLDDITSSQVWMAVASDMVAGALVLVPQKDFMQLANVAVHPEHRGIGLGRALMTLAETEARRQGYRELRLNTHVGIPENVRLYEHLGWERSGGTDSKVSMQKTL